MPLLRTSSRVFPVLVIGAASMYCLWTRNASNTHGPPVAYAHRLRQNVVTEGDKNKMIDNRLAGLHQDRTRIQAMIAVLNDPVNAETHETALLALARLGATEALPKIDALILANSDQEVTNYAIGARARLVAEAAVKETASKADAARLKVERFYQQMKLAPNDLNAAEDDYQQILRSPSSVGTPLVTPVGVMAVDELADMVYRGNYRDYESLPGIKEVNFGIDYGAALKIRLAPLSRQQRITTMISEMSSKTKWKMLDNLEGQLLADEGPAASQAIASKLHEVMIHRSQYSAEGIGSMFGVLGDIGDPSYAPLVESFKEDADPAVAEYAERSYGAIAKGIRVQVVYGY